MKNSVTPRAGVWIEIVKGCVWVCADGVTPRAGVWIEMSTSYTKTQRPLVTPRAGVWIEIKISDKIDSFSTRHSPCGSVD